MNKAILPTAQMLGLIAPATAALGLGYAQQRQNRTNTEAFIDEGLLGVLGNSMRNNDRAERQVSFQEPIAEQQQPRAPMIEEEKNPIVEEILQDEHADPNVDDEQQPLLDPANIAREPPVVDIAMNVNQAMAAADEMIQ